MNSNRNDRRSKYDEGTRISLLEDDMDKMEKAFVAIQNSQRQLSSRLMASIVSLLIAVIMLALNLAVGTLGG